MQPRLLNGPQMFNGTTPAKLGRCRANKRHRAHRAGSTRRADPRTTTAYLQHKECRKLSTTHTTQHCTKMSSPACRGDGLAQPTCTTSVWDHQPLLLPKPALALSLFDCFSPEQAAQWAQHLPRLTATSQTLFKQLI